MDRDFIINAIKKYNQKEYEGIKENADYLLQNQIRFIDNWAMERCEELLDFSDLNWEKEHNNDPEWTYMLNRQAYLKDLFIVFFVEKDKRYFNKLKEYIFSKIHVLGDMKEVSESDRTLDTGIRLTNWMFLLEQNRYYGIFTKEEEQEILNSILIQIDYLHRNFQDRYYLSNWGSMQIESVLLFHVLYKDLLKKEVTDFFEDALIKNLNLSIYEDGSHWEQSVMYHVEVLFCYLNLAVHDKKYKRILDEKMFKMAEYVYHATGPDFCQCQIGDSDCTDTRDILTWTALYFKDGRFKAKAFNHMTIFGYFLFPKEMIQEYQAMKQNLPRTYATFYENSGHIFLNDEKFYLFFKNGPMGSSHTHSDLNSLCLYYKKKPILVDSGRHTYMEKKSRYFLKSAKGHSSLIVDDENPEIIKGSWEYLRYPEAIHLELKTHFPVNYIESTVLGELEHGTYLHTRYLITFKDSGIFIVDKLKMKGKHRAELRFILDSKVKSLEEVGLKLLECEKYCCKKRMLSKKYNSMEETSMLLRKEEFQDTLYLSTVIYDENIKIKPLGIRQTNQSSQLKGSFIWEITDKDLRFLLNVNTEQIVCGSKLLIEEKNDIFIRGKCVIIDISNNGYYRVKS